MKQYVIFIYNETKEYDFHVRDFMEDQIRLSALNSMPETPKLPHQMDAPAPVYFTTSENYAKRLLKYLVDHFPDYSWGMAETKLMIRNIIKARETQFLSVDKKGTLPCDAW